MWFPSEFDGLTEDEIYEILLDEKEIKITIETLSGRDFDIYMTLGQDVKDIKNEIESKTGKLIKICKCSISEKLKRLSFTSHQEFQEPISTFYWTMLK